MKKTLIYSLILGGLIFLLPACGKFTEITPKGRNILNRVSDLDLLLNFNYSYNSAVLPTSLAGSTTAVEAFNPHDVSVVVNDLYPSQVNLATLLATANKTAIYAMVTYDETINRKALAIVDPKFEKMYFIINNVCNIILANADQASGDQVKAKQIKAEAYILRAYFHYLLVNLYAKAYDPATASTDGGIPYVKEDNLVAVPNKKSTVAEVYANLISDIDAAFALNSLPLTPINNMRVGRGFAFAVKARILLSTRNYAGALEAANASLAINSNVLDYNTFVGGTLSKPILTASENLFFAAYNGLPTFNAPSIEVLSNYEVGDVMNDYIKPYFPSAAGPHTNPFSGLPGSKLWYYPGTAYSVNVAGLTTSDTNLIKAECLAKNNSVPAAMTTLNDMRKKRIRTTVYADLVATTEAQAMAHIMKFSRIENLYTWKNYLNIKRWNTEPAYKQTITRTINGVTFTLKPESPLYIFPFPQSETNFHPELTQNY